MRIKNIIITLIFVIGSFAALLPSIAAPLTYDTVYVDDGTLGPNHFDTIDGALAEVNAGGTVYIGPGTYVITTTIIINSDVKIIGAGSDLVTIDGDGRLLDIFRVILVDFELSGCTLTGAMNGISVLSKDNEVNIFNNVIFDNNYNGILVRYGELLQTPLIDGLTEETQALLIHNNEIYGNGYEGIRVEANSYSALVKIYSNTIHDNGEYTNNTGIYVYDAMKSYANVEIYGNEIYDEDGNGIHIASNTMVFFFDDFGIFEIYDDFYSIHDNTIYGCSKNGIYTDVYIEYNSNVVPILSDPVSDGNGTGYNDEYLTEYMEIYKNTIHDNGYNGISMDVDIGIYSSNFIIEIVDIDGAKPDIISTILIAENEIFNNDILGINYTETVENHYILALPVDGDGPATLFYYDFLMIYRNEIYANSGGISLEGANDALIMNNLIAGNDSMELLDQGAPNAGITLFDSATAIVNNTLIANYTGLRYHTNDLVFIANNIFASNSCYGIEKFDIGSSGYDANGVEGNIIYNDVWNNLCSNYGGILLDQTGMNGNISEDPLFYGIFDARLSTGSPCIDTGDIEALVIVTEDLVGTPRIQRAGIDRGCYEMIGNLWSPKYIHPLAMLSLANANTMWSCILQNLPTDISPEVQELLDDVQGLMGQAGSLANPIYLNGLMQQALSLMEEVDGLLECGCHS